MPGVRSCAGGTPHRAAGRPAWRASPRRAARRVCPECRPGDSDGSAPYPGDRYTARRHETVVGATASGSGGGDSFAASPLDSGITFSGNRLIDADDQETATDFTILRNEKLAENAGYTSIKLTGDAVRTQTRQLSKKYDDIIIDTGGRDTSSQRAALTVADILLVPFVPRSFDVWTLEKVAGLVTEMRLPNPDLLAFTFINRADPRGVDNDEAAEILRESQGLTFINTPLGNRKAFANAAAQGLAVTEIKPQDAKATEEMMILSRYIFDIDKVSGRKGIGE